MTTPAGIGQIWSPEATLSGCTRPFSLETLLFCGWASLARRTSSDATSVARWAFINGSRRNHSLQRDCNAPLRNRFRGIASLVGCECEGARTTAPRTRGAGLALCAAANWVREKRAEALSISFENAFNVCSSFQKLRAALRKLHSSNLISVSLTKAFYGSRLEKKGNRRGCLRRTFSYSLCACKSARR